MERMACEVSRKARGPCRLPGLAHTLLEFSCG